MIHPFSFNWCHFQKKNIIDLSLFLCWIYTSSLAVATAAIGHLLLSPLSSWHPSTTPQFFFFFSSCSLSFFSLFLSLLYTHALHVVIFIINFRQNIILFLSPFSFFFFFPPCRHGDLGRPERSRRETAVLGFAIVSCMWRIAKGRRREPCSSIGRDFSHPLFCVWGRLYLTAKKKEKKKDGLDVVGQWVSRALQKKQCSVAFWFFLCACVWRCIVTPSIRHL